MHKYAILRWIEVIIDADVAVVPNPRSVDRYWSMCHLVPDCTYKINKLQLLCFVYYLKLKNVLFWKINGWLSHNFSLLCVYNGRSPPWLENRLLTFCLVEEVLLLLSQTHCKVPSRLLIYWIFIDEQHVNWLIIAAGWMRSGRGGDWWWWWWGVPTC